jgi:hypothetical protein
MGSMLSKLQLAILAGEVSRVRGFLQRAVGILYVDHSLGVDLIAVGNGK